MDNLKKIIKSNKLRHENFEEYYRIIDIIVSHKDINPDICIESCRALSEGICKTILIDLDNTKNQNNIDKDMFPKLFSDTMKALSKVCPDLEADFASRFSSFMSVINEIRNKRGEVSHGRTAPKFIYSSSGLANTVVQITDGILSYVLEHYFSLRLEIVRLDYNDEKLTNYNNWLDESTSFPIAKVKYSEILFQYDYDSYELSYKDDYLISELSLEKQEIISEVMTLLSKVVSENHRKIGKSPESKVTVDEDDGVKIISPSSIETFDYIPEYEYSVPEVKIISTFVDDNNLISEEIFKILDEYYFSSKLPLRDDISKTMKEKPSIKQRVKILDQLVFEIKNLIDLMDKNI